MKPVDSRIVTGYDRGIPFSLLVVRVGTIWLASYTAVRFVSMQDAARVDGVELIGTQGFRTNAEQTKIYESRRCTCANRTPSDEHAEKCPVAVKGPAAKPGWSAHQKGDAVDIRTGLTVSAFRHGIRTPVYEWLESRAREFGFARTVKAEPWHWACVGIEERRDP